MYEITIQLTEEDGHRLQETAKEVGLTEQEYLTTCLRGELDVYDYLRWSSRFPLPGGFQPPKPFGRDLEPGEADKIRAKVHKVLQDQQAAVLNEEEEMRLMQEKMHPLGFPL